jgi:hypothetical protein
VSWLAIPAVDHLNDAAACQKSLLAYQGMTVMPCLLEDFTTQLLFEIDR